MRLALHANEPLVARVRSRARPDHTRLAFYLGLSAVVIRFTVSGNLLAMMGVESTPDGNLLVKVDPATYIVVLAAIVAILGAPRPGDALAGLFRDKPGLAAFLILVPACTVYAMLNVGISGSAAYIETFLAPGLLCLALETGSHRQRRALGYLFLGFCLLNVGIAVLESLAGSHLLTLYIAGKVYDDSGDDFRGLALYDHPLVGALVTSMCVFLVLGMRLRPWAAAASFSLLLIGLLSFGGRAALFVTLSLLTLIAGGLLLHGLATRRLSGSLVAALVAGLFVLAPLLAMLATETSIGERVANHLYYDSSAAVREVEWRVLDYLTPHDVLFGVPAAAQVVMKAQIGLNGTDVDIENPWLLLFLNLGAIGFIVLLVALVLFLWHLGRPSSAIGRLILIATVLEVSASNSLGRKAPDLSFLVACMVASAGFVGYQRPAPAAARRRRAIDLRRHHGLEPAPAAPATARSLTRLPAGRASVSLLAGHGTR